ncbi:SRPBCC family protein [Kitasatospora azatica]|uniref:SRPBCC family protein n=1 Tax=Kitasatospora azatica TaxID=58347 RepID=UPI00055B12ED|nr:SRPBCC family protein [Kitasatospora azatica]
MSANGSTRSKWAATVSGSVPAPPDEVFALVTDIARLPEWNSALKRVIEQPAALQPGVEWVVRIRPAGWPGWASRSRLEELDPRRRVFRHRSTAEDRNPSYAEWRWQVEPDADGSRLTVSWELHPKTVGRRLLAAPLRHRRLVRVEVPDSIAALASLFARR